MTIKELYERAVELECENHTLCVDFNRDADYVRQVRFEDLYNGEPLEGKEGPRMVVIRAYDEVQA